MSESLRRLSRLSGLSPEELQGVWTEARANLVRLDACAGPHLFDQPLDPEHKLLCRWKCSRCGGTVDAVARQWYQKGLEHGRAGRLTLPVREG